MTSSLQNEMILASAGSGKTWQLTNRYIAIMGQSLIAGEEVQPERIVAVTFTRKAAGEFFESILRKLADAALDPEGGRKLAADPDDPLFPILSKLEQKDYLQLLTIFLRRMPAVFLGTLDSFFSAILRNFPAEFGLSSQFDVLDEHAANLARHDVYREVFRSRHDQHRAEFLEAFKRATFGQEEARVITQLDRFVSRHHEIFLHAAAAHLWGNPKSIWPSGSPWVGDQGSLPDDFEALLAIFDSEELSDGQLSFWQEFRDDSLQHSAGSAMTKRMKFFLGKFLDPDTWSDIKAGEACFPVARRRQSINAEACAVIHRITTGLIAGEIEVHLKRTQGIWHVLNQYENNYASLVRRRGHLTFSDLEVILSGCDLHDQSAPILSQKPDELDRLQIDYRLDGRYDHWLLDEFQDTSYTQWSIIEPLIDEAVQDVSQNRSLFQVGDVKQAIYAWRGGDTRLFDDIYERYRGSGDDPRALRPRPLNVSWRSGNDVIGMVNGIFGERDALEALEFPSDAVARWKWHEHEVAPPNKELPGYAAIYEPVPEAGDRVVAEDCYAITLELLEEIQPIKRGLTCAVLVQDNRSGRAIVDYLRAHTRSNIPVAGEADISPALDNAVTIALLNLIRVAAHPADRFCWQHLSLSPLSAILPDEVSTLSLEVLESIHRHGYEHTIRGWIDRMPPAGITLDAFAKHRAEELALAARLFDQSGKRNPDEFLEFAEGYKVREVAAASAVQVMTIHKSKGLTFDAVILPNLEGNSLTTPRSDIGVKRDRASRAVEWVFDIPPRMLADIDPVLHAYRLDQESEAGYEQLCKFYVALTRARHANYLVVPGLPRTSRVRNFVKLLHETIVAGDPHPIEIGAARALSLYESDQPTADPAWYLKAGTEPKSEDVPPGQPAAPAPRLEARTRPRRRTPSSHDTGSLPGGSLFSRKSNRARNHGSVVHALFESIEWLDDVDPGSDPPQWDTHRQQAAAVFESAHEEVKCCLAHPATKDILTRPRIKDGESVECWRERPFELVRDGDWISGVFDRVHVILGPDHVPLRATIVDFKTDFVESEDDASRCAERYQSQLENYRHALTQLLDLPAGRISTVLLFTKLPLVMESGT